MLGQFVPKISLDTSTTRRDMRRTRNQSAGPQVVWHDELYFGLAMIYKQLLY
jgi:hypothetical protein